MWYMEWFDPFQVYYGMYTWKLIPKCAKQFCQFHNFVDFSWYQNVPNNFVNFTILLILVDAKTCQTILSIVWNHIHLQGVCNEGFCSLGQFSHCEDLTQKKKKKT
jgi:hypothetical protein